MENKHFISFEQYYTTLQAHRLTGIVLPSKRSQSHQSKALMEE